MEKNYIRSYDANTIIKYLRKVLQELDSDYVDSSIRCAFIMKRYLEYYNLMDEKTAKLVLACFLKDVGTFYLDKSVPRDNHAYAAASTYAFLRYCSPLGDAARPLLFYKAMWIEDKVDKEDPTYFAYYYGLLITLINQLIMYNYQEYTLDQMTDLLKNDMKAHYNPEQVRKLTRFLKKEPKVLEILNSSSNLFLYETTGFLSKLGYTDDDLLKFIYMTNFSFEFHNNETLAHTITTAVIAKELAKLSRLPEGMVEKIYIAGLVHDIGKLRIPPEILCYPGKLEGEAKEIMAKHVIYTREILENSFSTDVIEIASNHHERLDGSGYPVGKKAIDLSIGDKILSVADVTSALYCKRSYKEAFSDDEILDILERCADEGKLDSRIINHLIDNYDEIMVKAKENEEMIVNQFNNMKKRFEALIQDEELHSFFDDENDSTDIIDEDTPF